MSDRSEQIVDAGRNAAWLMRILVIVVILGCAPAGRNRPAAVEIRTEDGFVISETARIGLGARADFERAMRAFAEEDYTQAIEVLVQVVEADPNLASAQINLGIAYSRIGRLEAAESSLLAALDANPRHPVALNELAMVYRRMGRFAEARERYQAALELHPNFHFAHLNLGILCDLYLSDTACALEHYERYLEVVPNDETASIWVDDLRNRIGQ